MYGVCGMDNRYWRNAVSGRAICAGARPFGEDWFEITEAEYRVFVKPDAETCTCLDKEGDDEHCPKHGRR